MHISVLTPDRELFEGEIVSMKVPGVVGQFQVLRNHAPIVSTLKDGEVVLQTAKGEARVYNDEKGTVDVVQEAGRKLSFHIERGFVEVLNNEINLLIEGVKRIG